MVYVAAKSNGYMATVSKLAYLAAVSTGICGNCAHWFMWLLCPVVFGLLCAMVYVAAMSTDLCGYSIHVSLLGCCVHWYMW